MPHSFHSEFARTGRMERQMTQENARELAPRPSDIDRLKAASADPLAYALARVRLDEAGLASTLGEVTPVPRDEPLAAYGHDEQVQLGIVDERVEALNSVLETARHAVEERAEAQAQRYPQSKSAVIDPRGIARGT
ncbi:MAG: hypothetical protein ACM31O_03705 [Bacteroidota bacterium]